MSPWLLDPAAGETTQLYPDYDATARLLMAAGVLPDFESDGSVRYTHRTLPDRDVYFVANRTNERVTTPCTFRVSERQAGTVGSVDGTIRRLPEYQEVDGRTQIPLQFEPYQSYFVVFRTQAAAHRGRRQRSKELPGDRTGRPRSTAPGMSRSTRRREDQGNWCSRRSRIGVSTHHPTVRHFSGIATYRRSFDLPDAPCARRCGTNTAGSGTGALHGTRAFQWPRSGCRVDCTLERRYFGGCPRPGQPTGNRCREFVAEPTDRRCRAAAARASLVDHVESVSAHRSVVAFRIARTGKVRCEVEADSSECQWRKFVQPRSGTRGTCATVVRHTSPSQIRRCYDPP